MPETTCPPPWRPGDRVRLPGANGDVLGTVQEVCPRPWGTDLRVRFDSDVHGCGEWAWVTIGASAFRAEGRA